MRRYNIPPCPFDAMGTVSSLYPREIGLLGSQAQGDWGRKGSTAFLL